MTPTLTIVGVGSNVDPQHHIAQLLDHLLHEFGVLHLSTLVSTAPVGMTDGSGQFLNLALAVPSGEAPARLQARLHELERQSGRDRDSPGQSWRARTLDLDVLFSVADTAPSPSELPDEPWIRPLVDQLLGHLRLADPPVAFPSGTAVSLTVGHHTIGEKPMSIHLERP